MVFQQPLTRALDCPHTLFKLCTLSCHYCVALLLLLQDSVEIESLAERIV
jgi:hypothetical protein